MGPPRRFLKWARAGKKSAVLLKNLRADVGTSSFPELEVAETGLERALQPAVRGIDLLCPECPIFGPICQRISQRLFVGGDLFTPVVGEHIEELHRGKERFLRPVQDGRRSGRVAARGPRPRRGRA